MRERLSLAFERFKEGSRALGRRVQQVVVTVLLVGLYVVGLGATRVLATVFFRRGLGLYASEDRPTYWLDAEGYDGDRDQLLKQF